METTGTAPTDPRRVGVYLAAVDAAEAEAREIDDEVTRLERRATAMRERAGSLRALSEALRALVPAQPGGSAGAHLPYVPIEIFDTPVQAARFACP
jgi:hypothetical protein